MKSILLAIDQGTTSSRAILFDQAGNIVAQAARRHEQIYPQPGYVSHNAKEILFNVVECVKKAIEAAAIDSSHITAAGIANQRETVVLWDRQTGEPVCDAIVWQCRRTADICKKIITDGFEAQVRQRTGLVADPYFSASKIRWILDNVPQARALLAQGRLLAGTIDSFLIWHLTGGVRHVTDYTNASRTMLFNIHDLCWDPIMLDYFDIPAEILPEVVSSSGECGRIGKQYFGAEIPITGIAGDQHAALFGQACFAPGDMKNTYGTGCFILANTGAKPVAPKQGLLTTIAWHLDGEIAYALEGSVFCAGAAIEWMIQEAKLVSDIDEINYLLSATADSGGVYFVPAFSGLSAPYWDMTARGAMFGMSLGTEKRHIVRAICESIAYQSRDVIEYMMHVAGFTIGAIKVDGGISRNAFIMQFQADMLGMPVVKSRVTETTALGVAYLAGLGAGVYDNIQTIKKMEQAGITYEALMESDERNDKYAKWTEAVRRTGHWLA